MGIDYSTGSGYGFIIPQELIDNVEQQHEDDDDYWDGFAEWLNDTLLGTPGVSYMTGGSYYSGELTYAVVADGTSNYRDLYGDEGGISYVDAVPAVQTAGNPDATLRSVAHILGVDEQGEVKLGWLTSFLIS